MISKSVIKLDNFSKSDDFQLVNQTISKSRFVLHLQDWWCVGKRETSFPVNKLWLIYLPPSLWPLTMSQLSITCANTVYHRPSKWCTDTDRRL